MSKQTWKCIKCNKYCHRTDSKCPFCQTWRPKESITNNNYDNDCSDKSQIKNSQEKPGSSSKRGELGNDDTSIPDTIHKKSQDFIDAINKSELKGHQF